MRAGVAVAIGLALGGFAWWFLTPPERAPVANPIAGPLVSIDVGHHNFGMSADLGPLTSWLKAIGFAVRPLRGEIDAQALDGVRIVLIKNALAARNAVSAQPSEAELARAWSLPTPSAFSAAEITTLRDWVIGGGSLLLVFDHMPMPGAASELAAAFGIEVSNGHAVDAAALEPFAAEKVERAGRVVFSRADGSLADDPLTNGRRPSERSESIVSDGGSAFRLPAEARSLLRLGPSFVSLTPESAWRFSPATPRTPVAGWSQGGVLLAGRGRVAVFGEGSILVSPGMAASLGRWGSYTAKGEAADFSQNSRLLRNVLDWLAGRATANRRSG